MAATAAVFDTYELAENIAIQIPLTLSLTMTRVRKSYREMFEKSKPIRHLLSDCELPGCDTIIDNTRVNRDKTTPWIFRTPNLSCFATAYGQGRFLIYSTPSTRFVVFIPQNPTKKIISSGIEMSILPAEGSKGGWRCRWQTSDGDFIGVHHYVYSEPGPMVFESYLKEFYPVEEYGPDKPKWCIRKGGAVMADLF